MKNLKTNIHASAAAVDESFEDLEALAAVAGSEDSEDLDEDDDSEYTEEEEEDDTEDVDDDVIDEDSEDDSEDESEDDSDESEDEDSEDDSDDSEEEVTEEDASDDEEDDDYEITEEDASEDECEDDEEYTEEDASEDEEYEEVESSEDDEEVDEDAVLASLAEEGLLVVISTTEQISERALGMAVAALEDEEFGDDEEVDADEEDFEEDVSDEDDIGEDDSEDATEEEDSEDETEEDDSEDDEEEITEEDDSEDDDSEDTEEEVTDDEADSDTEDDLEIDEDRLAPVASREMLAHASVEDVEFVLHASKSNPVWNVIVAGVPAARLALSSYGDGAEEVRSFFTTKQFVDGVKRAMASEGVLGLLDKSNAEYYANAYKSSEVFAEARAHAERIGNQKVTAATSGLREDFVDAMKIAAAGMDKNFFQKPNALKRSLFIALSGVGVQQPAALIESVFAEASSDYFETLAETAEEFLDMPSEARETLRNTIENSGVIDRTRDVGTQEKPAQAATASALDLIRGMAATASVENVSGSLTGSHSDRKNAIRNLF